MTLRKSQSKPNTTCFPPNVGLKDNDNIDKLMEHSNDLDSRSLIGERFVLWSIIYTYIQIFNHTMEQKFKNMNKNNNNRYKEATEEDIKKILYALPSIFYECYKGTITLKHILEIIVDNNNTKWVDERYSGKVMAPKLDSLLRVTPKPSPKLTPTSTPTSTPTPTPKPASKPAPKLTPTPIPKPASKPAPKLTPTPTPTPVPGPGTGSSSVGLSMGNGSGRRRSRRRRKRSRRKRRRRKRRRRSRRRGGSIDYVNLYDIQ